MAQRERSSSREARRKRILRGGSDRMALITGTIQSLPPSPPPLLSSEDDQIHQVGVEEDALVSLLPRNVIGNESVKANAFDIGSQVVHQMLEDEESAEEKQAPVEDLTNKLGECPVTSIMHKASTTDTKRSSKLHNYRCYSLTPKQISSCIISSEATRIICSLMIALLVVLSYVDRPLLGRNLVKSESVVAPKPFYILLLTDITILLARLSIERRSDLEKAKEEEEEEERMARHEEDGHNWVGAIKVLESGVSIHLCSFHGLLCLCRGSHMWPLFCVACLQR